ncbi:MAG: NAD(P)/FAD-dependent oxidoreductase [Oscillospiraceae bacterium]
MYDVIIIGGGPAGLTAAIYSSRAGLSALVLEKLSPGGQASLTYEIDNYPGFKQISGIELAGEFESHAKASGAEIAMEEVTALDLDGEIKTAATHSDRYEAKTVILAMGSERRKLGIPGENEFFGRGVSYCATCDGNFFRGRDVAVLGGGNTAAGFAVELSEICRHVTLIHHSAELSALFSLKNQISSRSNISVLFQREAEEILGSISVEQLKLKNKITGETSLIDVNGVFIAVGIKPSSSIINEKLLFPDGFIRADEKGVTPVPGVFAAGDLRKKQLYQIVTAMSDGANAAYSAQLYLQNSH